MVPGGVDTTRVETFPAPTGTSFDALSARVLDAALDCIARYGVAKTTVDDIAKGAGCSRATLYRKFPGKANVLAAMVAREGQRLRDAITAAVDPNGTLDSALTATIVTTARLLDANTALRHVLAHEPEAVMHHLAFERGDVGLAYAATLGNDIFGRWLTPAAAERCGELMARIVLSHLTHEQIATLTEHQYVQELVNDFVAPGFRTLSQATRYNAHG